VEELEREDGGAARSSGKGTGGPAVRRVHYSRAAAAVEGRHSESRENGLGMEGIWGEERADSRRYLRAAPPEFVLSVISDPFMLSSRVDYNTWRYAVGKIGRLAVGTPTLTL
jgi:hypothetical protein